MPSKKLPISSAAVRILNKNAASNKSLQRYQKHIVEKAKRSIEKLEKEIQQLEQSQ